MSEKRLAADPGKLSEARAFLAGFRSVVLGSITANGRPHSSYAPFIIDRGRFYVYVSGLARHATTLQNGHASLLFIEEESRSKTIFARRRLTIDCSTQIVPRNTPDHERLLDLMQAELGSTLEVLRTLPDFILFAMTPSSADFVTGFGAAFVLTPSLGQLLEPVSPT